MRHAFTLTASGLRAAALAALVSLGAASSAAPAHAIEPVQRVVSPGGIEALLIESHQVGIISMRFSFKGGAIQEPVNKEGVAGLVSYMFNEGAGDMPTQELMRKLSRLGATFAGDTNTESLQVNFVTPSAERAAAFDLLKLAIASPRYDAEPLERAKRNSLAGINQEKMDPGSVAYRRLSALLYGDDRFTYSTKGNPDAIPGITMDDVRAYRARMFAKDNLRIAVTGDIDAASLKVLLDDVFGSLPAKSAMLPEPAMASAKPQVQSIALDLPQTIVVFGNTLPSLTPRQGLAASLFNQILSASFTGRLFTKVRGEQGLVYSIGTMRGRMEKLETFFGSFGAAPGNAPRALTLTMDEIRRLAADGPSEDELANAKSAFRGSYYFSLDTTPNLSAVLLTMVEQRLPDTYLADFDAEVASVTIDEVREAGRMMARPDDMVVVSVGKVDEASVKPAIP